MKSPDIEVSLEALEGLINSYVSSDQCQSNTEYQAMNTQFEGLATKLKKKIHLLVHNNESTKEEKAEESTLNELEKEKQIFMNIIKVLSSAALKKESPYIAWLCSLIKINANDSYLKSAFYEPPQQASTNAVIALPCDAVIASASSNDAQKEELKVEAKQYYLNDEELTAEYFSKLFVTVKREGVSEFGVSVVDWLCRNYFELLLKEQEIKYSFEGFILFVQLLESVCAPIYTLYLISLFELTLKKAGELLENEVIKTSINSEKINKLIYGFKSISSRWEGSVHYSLNWEWNIKSKAIVAFLASKVSQTKLTGIKMLVSTCRNNEYSPIESEEIEKYIRNNHILEQVFSPDSHPEVISKGKEICEFLTKRNILEEAEIDILLNLLDKSHENVCKSVSLTIQSLGQANLTIYYQKIITKISQLTRASFFTDETLQLIETLMVIAPIKEMKQNLSAIYLMIHRHYVKLRKHLREKLVRLYFELFIAGVEENVFAEEDQLAVIDPIANNLRTNLSALLLDTFIRVVKMQKGKIIEEKAKKILNLSLLALFQKYKIHTRIDEIEVSKASIKVTKANSQEILSTNPNFYSKEIHLALIKHLLELYEGSELPITYEELSELIKEDISFTSFVQFYGSEEQRKVIELLLNQETKDGEHISNIMVVYSLVNAEIKEEVFGHIYNWFLNDPNLNEKKIVAEFILNNSSQKLKIENLCLEIEQLSQEKQTENQLSARLVLLEKWLEKNDQTGFGSYLPFSFLSETGSVLVKVTNMMDVIIPTFSSFSCQAYKRLNEIILIILAEQKLLINEVNFKVFDKSICINDFTKIIGQMARHVEASEIPQNKVLQISFTKMIESEWFDKSQLINEGILNDQVMMALGEIFTNFTSSGKMHRNEAARIFEIATETERITENDSRIDNLFSLFSSNGEYLTLEEWLNFYQKSSEDNPCVVVNNIKKLGYCHLFKSEEELLSGFNENIENEVRAYLSSISDSFYKVLFQDYENEMLTKLCIELLELLPLKSSYLPEKQDEEKVNIENLCKDLYCLQKMTKTEKWYVLFLSHKLDDKFFWNQGLITNFIEFLNSELQNQSQLETVHLQNLLNVVTILKKYFKELSSTNLPKTLLNTKQNNQNYSNFDENIQDVLESFSESSEFPHVSLEKIEKLVLKIYAEPKIFSHSGELIDGLVLLYLLSSPNPKEESKVNTELIFHQNVEVRTIFNNLYFLICKINPKIKESYYQLNLLPNFDHFMNEAKLNEDRFLQFYRTFNKILLEESNEDELNVYKEVSTGIEQSLRKYAEASKDVSKYNEKGLVLYNQNPIKTCDDILLGKLMLLDSMKVYHPELEINNSEEWLSNLLFESHSNETRNVLYRISSKLCPVGYNLGIIRKLMSGVTIHKNSKEREQMKMGLFNLGCICYINSTIQQLFMIEPFTRGIVSFGKTTDKSSYFYNLQYMFYQLAFGQREFFVPDEFCLNYTDFDNKPIDIKQQHDADEFLNSLLDRLESTLKQDNDEENAEELIRKNFCGELSNVITCQSCFSRKLKVEDFYVLTLDIKNNNNLMECFDKLTEPEVITDYYCDECEKKVEMIEKQMHIKKLPSFLFIHLQRLVFDLESFSKIKLEHLVDYPEELNLSDYFENDEFNESESSSKIYQLKGFIVHVGTSESGHYYSVIKEKGKWVKFDDSRIDWCEPNLRDKENTYIIIYEKKTTDNIVSNCPSPNISISNHELLLRVKEDNQKLLKETIFLQSSFTKYLLSTLSQISIPPSLLITSPNLLETPFNPQYTETTSELKEQLEEAHDIILDYLRLTGEAKSANLNQYQFNATEFKNATCYLIMIYHICPHLVLKAIQNLCPVDNNGKIDTKYLRSILVQSDKTMRQAYKIIFVKILTILNSCSESIVSNYLVPAPINSHLWYLQRILEYLNGSLYDAAKNYSKMEEHFEFFELTLQVSNKICDWFEEQGLGPKLIQFICGDDTKIGDEVPKFYYNNSKKNEAINSIVKILHQIIKCSVSKEKNLSELNSVSNKAYYLTNWYQSLYNERYLSTEVSSCLCLLSQKNPHMTQEILNLIIEKLNRFNHTDSYIQSYIELLTMMLSSNDNLVSAKCMKILGVPILFVEEGKLENRYFKYWNNEIKCTDEVMLPLLELLYTNRLEINVFTLALTHSLLKVMLQNQQVYQYVINLPAPAPHQYYTDWIPLLLKNGLKSTSITNTSLTENTFNINAILNEIAYLLNCVEQLREDLHGGKGGDSNRWFGLEGELKKTESLNERIGDVCEVELEILQDSKGTKIVKYYLKLDEKVSEATLKFIQFNYHYEFNLKTNLEIAVPFPMPNYQTQFPQLEDIFKVEVTKQNKIEEKKSEIASNTPDWKESSENNMKEVGYNNNSQNVESTQNNEQIFECPFCTSISLTFASRCPTCGEEWGEMM